MAWDKIKSQETRLTLGLKYFVQRNFDPSSHVLSIGKQAKGKVSITISYTNNLDAKFGYLLCNIPLIFQDHYKDLKLFCISILVQYSTTLQAFKTTFLFFHKKDNQRSRQTGTCSITTRCNPPTLS